MSVDFKRIKSSITKSRCPKFQGWKILQRNYNRHYDVIIYCDAYLSPTYDIDLWNNIVNLTLASSSGIVQSKHPQRNCAYAECAAIVKFRRDTQDKINKTLAFMKNQRLPYENGLYFNGYFAYAPKKIKCVKLFDYLWNILKQEIYTHRDQPLYALSCYKTRVLPTIFDLSPYFEKTGKCGRHIYA